MQMCIVFEEDYKITISYLIRVPLKHIIVFQNVRTEIGLMVFTEQLLDVRTRAISAF